MRRIVSEHNLTFIGSLGVGDTDSDIPMLQLVERPIAFQPNKELLEHAVRNGWEVAFERKDAILHLKNPDGSFEMKSDFGYFTNLT